ncbi:putative MFS multidrug transporter [Nadsonia fulvescens var. elongata DSM 6958]|uniref:Putative MFS multidrug transporter n=1 Tax=Nadsonia fulvescens var. elongata DSM 6958 TaxID=857566 RepID=A0A1E3PK73_9ASCO|nr:putative MFS multidrug transporter [Nadsonia fulvescens var. elongata DSM 6958]
MPLEEIPTHVTYRESELYPSETAQSLAQLGVSSTVPKLDINAPILTSNCEPEFPEEYTLETETGLVPVSSILSLRTTRTKSRFGPTMSLNRGNEVQFVTFKINDPENPQNWSRAYRWYMTSVVSMLVVCVAYGSAFVTGGLGLISDKYNVSQEVSILTCSLMVLGFMVGPLLWSPMSEIIGRRPVYIISLSLYVIFNIPCALSPNIGGLLVCRFLCGVFASSGLSLAGGTLADIWKQEDRGLAIAFFAAAPYGGPVVGPIVCGWINIGTGRLDLFFWVNMAFSGVIAILVGQLPETFAPVILKQRAKKLRKELQNDKIMTEAESHKLSFSAIAKTCLIRPLYMIATEPVLDLMNLYVVLIYSLLYAFFFAYPVIFGEPEAHHFNDGFIGLMFIPILMGAMLALFITPMIEKQYAKVCATRAPTPEDRLIGAMIGAPFVPIALFILGSTAHPGIVWVGPAMSGLSFGVGMVLVYYSVNNYIIDSYSSYAASALAAKVFMRSGGGAAFPLFTTQMYHKLGNLWASFLLAFISLAMVLIPFVFYKYGAQLRARYSKVE